MAQIAEYGRFSVLHFPEGGQQHDEDCQTFTAAQRRYRDLAALPEVADVQLYGWLSGTNEPHLLKESDDGTPARKSRRSPPRAPGKEPQAAAAEYDRHQEQHEPALGRPDTTPPMPGPLRRPRREAKQRYGLPVDLLADKDAPQIQRSLFGEHQGDGQGVPGRRMR